MKRAAHLAQTAVTYDSEGRYSEALATYVDTIECLMGIIRDPGDASATDVLSAKSTCAAYIDRAEALKMMLAEEAAQMEAAWENSLLDVSNTPDVQVLVPFEMDEPPSAFGSSEDAGACANTSSPNASIPLTQILAVAEKSQDDPRCRGMQSKAYLRWIGAYVEQFVDPPRSLSDLFDGRMLSLLVMMLSGQRLDVIQDPVDQSDDIVNMKLVIDCVSDRCDVMPDLNAAEIVRGDERILLVLLWVMAYQFQVDSVLFSGQRGIPAIIEWTRSCGARAKDLSGSWQDGMELCAIAKHYGAEIGSLDDLNSSEEIENVELALSELWRLAQIPMLMDPEDFVDPPDEICILLTLACAFQKLENTKLDNM